MIPTINVVGYRPDVLVAKGQVMIRCEVIEFESGRARQSGTFVHLAMTAEDAMRLLALLKETQQQCGWPDHSDPPISVHVPPE
jgi:hypothetical protein